MITLWNDMMNSPAIFLGMVAIIVICTVEVIKELRK